MFEHDAQFAHAKLVGPVERVLRTIIAVHAARIFGVPDVPEPDE